MVTPRFVFDGNNLRPKLTNWAICQHQYYWIVGDLHKVTNDLKQILQVDRQHKSSVKDWLEKWVIQSLIDWLKVRLGGKTMKRKIDIEDADR